MVGNGPAPACLENSVPRAEPFCRLATQRPLAVRTDLPLGQRPFQPAKARVCPCPLPPPPHPFLRLRLCLGPLSHLEHPFPPSLCATNLQTSLELQNPRSQAPCLWSLAPMALGSSCLGCHMPAQLDALLRAGGCRPSFRTHPFFTHVSFTTEGKAEAQRG